MQHYNWEELLITLTITVKIVTPFLFFFYWHFSNIHIYAVLLKEPSSLKVNSES